jgi:gluconolactonase
VQWRQVDRLLDAAHHFLVDPHRADEALSAVQWSEGPVWRKDGDYLLFTDVPKNTIYKWEEEEGLSVFLRPSGHTVDAGTPGTEGGSNGLTFDAEGRLVTADHGNRMVARLDEETFVKTSLAERFEGKRLNSPNDLVFNSRGDLFFIDPPYGLEGGAESPHKELEFSGVYRLSAAGELTLLDRELRFPNGVALSPDERTLYVSNSDPERAIIMSRPRIHQQLGAGHAERSLLDRDYQGWSLRVRHEFPGRHDFELHRSP